MMHLQFRCRAILLWTVFSGLVLRAQPGSNDPTFNPYDDGTYNNGFWDGPFCVSADAQGRILIGGEFPVTRLTADGAVDTSYVAGSLAYPGWNTNDPPRVIGELVMYSDSLILAAGFFTHYNGRAVGNIVRLLPTGNVDTMFQSAGTNGTVNALAIQPDAKIIVGGAFSQTNGGVTGNLVRLLPGGLLDTSFSTGSGFDADVDALWLQPDGKLLAGGNFTTFNGEPCSELIRINEDGSRDTSFMAPISAAYQIGCITSSSAGDIWVGGRHISYSSQP